MIENNEKPKEKTNKKTYLILFVIVTIGAVLRYYAIGDEAFWNDEAYTAWAIRECNTKDIMLNWWFFGSITPNKNPLECGPLSEESCPRNLNWSGRTFCTNHMELEWFWER